MAIAERTRSEINQGEVEGMAIMLQEILRKMETIDARLGRIESAHKRKGKGNNSDEEEGGSGGKLVRRMEAHGDLVTRRVREELPGFEGDRVHEWLGKCEQLFELEGTPAEMRVSIASVCLSGSAREWHCSFIKNRIGKESASWEEYTNAIVTRFGSIEMSEPLVQLKGLREGESFSEYVNSFVSLVSQVDLTDEEQVAMFVEGFKGNDKKLIRVLSPKNLQHAIAFARALIPEGDPSKNRERPNDLTVKVECLVPDPTYDMAGGLVQQIKGIDRLGAGQMEFRRNNGDGEAQKTLLQLLNQFDGYKVPNKIEVLMATYRMDIMDQVLLRPGQVDIKIEFPNPNEEFRVDILKTHSRKMDPTRGIARAMQGKGFEALYGYSPPTHLNYTHGTTINSEVETILDKENLILEEFLNEEKIIRKCQAPNSRLINFWRERHQKVVARVSEVKEEILSRDNDRLDDVLSGYHEESDRFHDNKDVGESRRPGDGELDKRKVPERKGDASESSGKTSSGARAYTSFMSKFDEYVINEKSNLAESSAQNALRYGYKVGDMVRGKVKSHPWWPGHIFNEAFATSSMRKSRKNGSVLVAYFGNRSYGWFDRSELIPFELNCAEKSNQITSRAFIMAVEKAVGEAVRMRGLGLTFYLVNRITKARESFMPLKALSFVKQLALAPKHCDSDSLDAIQNKSMVFAYRKAIVEEFDETYAQAFGLQAARPSYNLADVPLSKEPSRAPLSGPLVIAEALGGARSSAKPVKAKNHSKKEKYLLKRIDDTNGHQIIQTPGPALSSAAYKEGLSASAAGGYVLQKKGNRVTTTVWFKGRKARQSGLHGSFILTNQSSILTAPLRTRVLSRGGY